MTNQELLQKMRIDMEMRGLSMMYHPHVHIVATGRGLTSYGKWKEKENDFFIPVKVMSRVFRGKFMSYLKSGY